MTMLTDESMESVVTNGMMAVSILVTGEKIKLVVLEYIPGWTVEDMRVNG